MCLLPWVGSQIRTYCCIGSVTARQSTVWRPTHLGSLSFRVVPSGAIGGLMVWLLEFSCVRPTTSFRWIFGLRTALHGLSGTGRGLHPCLCTGQRLPFPLGICARFT